MGKKEGAVVFNNILQKLYRKNKRENLHNLLDSNSRSGPGAKVDLPPGVRCRSYVKIMGNRVKNYIGNTFEIFENTEAGFFSKISNQQDKILTLPLNYL